MNTHLKISIVFAATLLVLLFLLCWRVGGDAETWYLNVGVFVFSWALGWLIGTLVAPYDPAESTMFRNISRALSAFVSGYLLAKIDPLVGAIFRPEFILQPVHGFRAIVFFSVTAVVTIVVFFARKYTNWHRME